MIEFRPLPYDHPDLAHSPMLRGMLLTLQYAQEHGSIGLTKTKAFKRIFVHWAVEHFEWPGKSADDVAVRRPDGTVAAVFFRGPEASLASMTSGC